jgi:hypothetical protein
MLYEFRSFEQSCSSERRDCRLCDRQVRHPWSIRQPRKNKLAGRHQQRDGGNGGGFFPENLAHASGADTLDDPVMPEESTWVETRFRTNRHVTHDKDALVYVDGGYVGPVAKAKNLPLPRGNHDVELRGPSGNTLYRESVQVIPGRTTEIHPDLAG